MNKKIMGIGVALLACSMLYACSNNLDENSKNEPNSSEVLKEKNDLKIEILDGEYVIMKKSEIKTYLALKLKFTNNGEGTIPISTSNIGLYDKNDNKIISEMIYSKLDDFTTFSDDAVNAGKSFEGYIAFEVDPKEKYELTFTPKENKTEDGADVGVVTINIDASDYKDETEQSIAATKAFIEGVFFNGNENGNSLSTSAELTNELTVERARYNEKLVDEIVEMFGYYKPTRDEAQKLVEVYEAANAKRAVMEYNIQSFTPESAIVNVKPQVLDFDSPKRKAIIDEYANKNISTLGLFEAREAGEKLYFEKLPKLFDTNELITPYHSPEEGLNLHLKRDIETGKWTVDVSDSADNSDYNTLSELFLG